MQRLANQDSVGVVHSGYDQGGGAFAFGGEFFAQLFGSDVGATFFDLEGADLAFAQIGLKLLAVKGKVV